MANKKNISKEWKVHTSELLTKLLENSTNGAGVLAVPTRIFASLLAQVGERCAEINDDKLNALMCRLTIYSIADPYSEDYDKNKVREILKKAK